MTLIKHSNADRVMKSAIVLDLGDLRKQAEQIIADAKARADQIVADGKAEAQRLIDQAAEKGRVQGIEEGRLEGAEQGRTAALAEFRERLDTLTAQWTAAVEEWERQRREFMLEAREDVLAFALLAARKVVHRVVAAEPEAIRDQLTAALALLSRPSRVLIHLHPADRAIVEAALPDVVALARNCEHAELHEDESITPGGCIVSTRGGTIDASIEAQLDRIVETLLPADRKTPDATTEQPAPAAEPEAAAAEPEAEAPAAEPDPADLPDADDPGTADREADEQA